MGSGSSSQVKTIHDTSVINNTAVLTGKEATAPNTTITRAVTDPNMPLPAHSNKEVVSPATVMKPTSSIPQSTGNSQCTPKVASPMASTSSDHERKLEQLQKELNESESEKLDLQDRIQALEERLLEVTSAAASSSRGEESNNPDDGSGEATATDLQETLRAKDLYIQQMEKQLAAAEAESKKVKVRLRKKIKNLTEQLNEAKQESSIAQMELKEHNKELQEQLCHSSQGGMSAMAPRTSGEEEGDKDPKMKIILDLSAEVSEQSNQISMLERTVKQKDKEIERLKRELSTPRQTVQPVPSEQTSPSFRSQTFTQPIRSSSLTQQDPYSRHLKITGPSSHTGVAPVETVRDYNTIHGTRPISKIGPRPTNPPQHRLEEELILHRQSTALSDSDSDWEVDMSSSKNRSAPARVRVKSAASSAHEMPTNRPEVEDKWSVATDDNDLTMTAESRPIRGNSGRQKRKSALKTRLERERNERAKCLMGPSLAFGTPASDQLSDVSATPTPRHAHADLGSQFTTSDVMAFVA